MRDRRLLVFRSALDGLIESLDAMVRVTTWNDASEAPPQPLRDAASKLTERLGVADRLASSSFVGTSADTTRVNAMCATMRKLDADYLTYRKHLEIEPAETAIAAAALAADIADAIAEAKTH